jgi:hypothetical protein
MITRSQKFLTLAISLVIPTSLIAGQKIALAGNSPVISSSAKVTPASRETLMKQLELKATLTERLPSELLSANL